MNITSKPLLIFLFFLLCACDSPSLEFQGKKIAENYYEGMKFSIYQNATRVQVVRTGFADAKTKELIPSLFVKAIHDATGCNAASIEGDLEIAVASLAC